jgi:hypothetical protein
LVEGCSCKFCNEHRITTKKVICVDKDDAQTQDHEPIEEDPIPEVSKPDKSKKDAKKLDKPKSSQSDLDKQPDSKDKGPK